MLRRRVLVAPVEAVVVWAAGKMNFGYMTVVSAPAADMQNSGIVAAGTKRYMRTAAVVEVVVDTEHFETALGMSYGEEWATGWDTQR